MVTRVIRWCVLISTVIAVVIGCRIQSDSEPLDPILALLLVIQNPGY